jgi:hypothetical protein
LHLYTSKYQALQRSSTKAPVKDDRILAWDVWNGPRADNFGSYAKQELKDTPVRMIVLLPQVFEWGSRGESHTAAHQRSLSGRHLAGWSKSRRTAADSTSRIRHHHVSQLHLARVFPGSGAPAEEIQQARNLLQIHGASPAPATRYCRLPIRSASEPSIGASSPAKRKPICRGNHGSTPTLSISRQCGSTKCCTPTEHLILWKIQTDCKVLQLTRRCPAKLNRFRTSPHASSGLRWPAAATCRFRGWRTSVP